MGKVPAFIPNPGQSPCHRTSQTGGGEESGGREGRSMNIDKTVGQIGEDERREGEGRGKEGGSE